MNKTIRLNLPESQTAAPLLEALQAAAIRQRAAFHTPGHKQGQGAPPAFVDLLGSKVFRADLPELPELDNLFAPEEVIQQAQQLAAAAFGAEQTWFLANGSTCGIEAAVLATCNPGDKIIVPRNAHQSVIAALILSGALPVFIEPESDPDWGIAHSVTPTSVAAALFQFPDAKAVMMVSPTYYGACGDVGAIAQIVHEYGIPLLVDEAHGAHFAFHPDLPTPALVAGADLTVQSIHKTLSALTQAAMLHVQGCLIDRDRLNKALQLVQSSSPSYLLLASLDAARQQMATQGRALMAQTLELAAVARTQISQIPGLSVLQSTGRSGFTALDPTRLTVDVSALGLTGFAADEILHQDLGVTAELPSLQHLTFIITLGNTEADIEWLEQGFRMLATEQRIKEAEQVRRQAASAQPLNLYSSAILPFTQSLLPALSPREAFFAPTVTLPIEQAIAQISAELVCPYPPGIPVLFPGEAITIEQIRYLQQIMAAGSVITGCSDTALQTLKVVKAGISQ